MGEVAAGEAGIMGARRAGDVSQCGGWASNSSSGSAGMGECVGAGVGLGRRRR